MEQHDQFVGFGAWYYYFVPIVVLQQGNDRFGYFRTGRKCTRKCWVQRFVGQVLIYAFLVEQFTQKIPVKVITLDCFICLPNVGQLVSYIRDEGNVPGSCHQCLARTTLVWPDECLDRVLHRGHLLDAHIAVRLAALAHCALVQSENEFQQTILRTYPRS